jgi:hypothetical protein
MAPEIKSFFNCRLYFYFLNFYFWYSEEHFHIILVLYLGVTAGIGRNRTRNIAENTWCLKPLSYARHPLFVMGL